MSEWIDISDKLPDKHGEIIIQTRSGDVTCGLFHISTRNYKRPEVSTRKGGRQFVKWMPLPEPQKN